MSIIRIIQMLGPCMLVSVEIILVTLIFALPIGMIVCFGRRSKNKIISTVVRFYISVMRGTPLMLQLFVVYFCPYYVFGIRLSVFGANYSVIAAMIGFIINYAAYFAEIYRSGIESMSSGQYEAAKVLGYSRPQTFCHIILPQVIRRILPTVTNEVITLVKDTSLAATIGVLEMYKKATDISSSENTLTAIFVAGVFYYIFNFVVAFVMELLEKKMNYYSIK